MAEPVLHVELLRGAADVFERQAARIHYEQGVRAPGFDRGLTGAPGWS
jgi:hypothetical protein